MLIRQDNSNTKHIAAATHEAAQLPPDKLNEAGLRADKKPHISSGDGTWLSAH